MDKLQWPVSHLPTRNKIADVAPSSENGELLNLLRRENAEDQKLYEFIREQGVFNSVPDNFDFKALRPHGSA